MAAQLHHGGKTGFVGDVVAHKNGGAGGEWRLLHKSRYGTAFVYRRRFGLEHTFALQQDDTGHLLHSGLQGVAAERFECGGMAVVQRNGGLFALETQAGVLVCQTLCGGGNGLQVRCIHCKQQPGSTASPGTMFTGNGQMQRCQKVVYFCDRAARDDGQSTTQPGMQDLDQKWQLGGGVHQLGLGCNVDECAVEIEKKGGRAAKTGQGVHWNKP